MVTLYDFNRDLTLLCLCLLHAGRRGYAPAAKLLRYHQPTEEPPPSPHLTLTDGVTAARRHSYTPEGRPLTVLSQPCFQVID